MATYQTGPFAAPRRVPNASHNPSLSPRTSKYVPDDIAPDEIVPDGYDQRAYMPNAPIARPPLETANSQRSKRSEPPRQPYALNQSNLRAAEDQYERSPDNLHPDHALSWGPYADQQQRRLSVDQIPNWQHPDAPNSAPDSRYGRRSSYDGGVRRGGPPPAPAGGPQHIAFANQRPPSPGSDYDDGYAAGFNAGRRSSRPRPERRPSQSSRDERRPVHDDEGYDSHEDRRARRSSYSGQSRRDREREDRRRKRRSSEMDRRPTLSDSVEHALINLKNAFTGGR